MLRFSILALILASACDGCAGCHYDVPDVVEHTGEVDSGGGDTGVRDTGPEPYSRCAVDEVEPNGSPATAQQLPLEARACGAFSTPLDLDFWTFFLPRAQWLRIEVGAQGIGSDARPVLLISSDAGEEAAVDALLNGEDPALVFPASAGAWDLLLSEHTGQGDDTHYPYELLIGESKPAVDWNVDEGDNDTLGGAQGIMTGDAVFGLSEDRWDQDWYAIQVPPGKHAITLDVDAWAAGSAGDYTLAVFHGDDPDHTEELARLAFGEEGWEPDPWGVLSSAGGEVLWVRVIERAERSGPAYWYRLSVTVEED
ncbi:MAG: hypothetical protein JXX28_17605 [Deltaproteobacteria bacterium]|nr:hypothetical protein [Deltaproteobacteria bacterium]